MRHRDIDNRWTVLATLASAASGVAQAVIDRNRRPEQDPALHERVALLERRVEELEKDS